MVNVHAMVVGNQIILQGRIYEVVEVLDRHGDNLYSVAPYLNDGVTLSPVTSGWTVGQMQYHLKMGSISLTTKTAKDLLSKLTEKELNRYYDIIRDWGHAVVTDAQSYWQWLTDMSDFDLGVYIANDTLENGMTLAYSLANGITWLDDRETAVIAYSRSNNPRS